MSGLFTALVPSLEASMKEHELGGNWVADGVTVRSREELSCCGKGDPLACAITPELARRIAAAVRATAGIPVEALEAGALAEGLVDIGVAAISQSDEVLRKVCHRVLRSLGRLKP